MSCFMWGRRPKTDSGDATQNFVNIADPDAITLDRGEGQEIVWAADVPKSSDSVRSATYIEAVVAPGGERQKPLQAKKGKGFLQGLLSARNSSSTIEDHEPKTSPSTGRRRHSITDMAKNSSPFRALTRRRSCNEGGGDIIDTTAAFYHNHFITNRQNEACFDMDYNDLIMESHTMVSAPNLGSQNALWPSKSQPLTSFHHRPNHHGATIDEVYGDNLRIGGAQSCKLSQIPSASSSQYNGEHPEHSGHLGKHQVDNSSRNPLSPTGRRRGMVGMTRDGDINVFGLPIDRLIHSRASLSISAPIPKVIDPSGRSCTVPLPPVGRARRRSSGVIHNDVVLPQHSLGSASSCTPPDMGGSAEGMHTPRYTSRRSSIMSINGALSGNIQRLTNNDEFVSDEEDFWDEEVNELADLIEPAYKYDGFSILGTEDIVAPSRPASSPRPPAAARGGDSSRGASTSKASGSNSKSDKPPSHKGHAAMPTGLRAAIEVRSAREAAALESLAQTLSPDLLDHKPYRGV